MDSDWVESVVKKHENDRQIFKVVKLITEGGIPKGSNYASVISRVKCEVLLGSGRRTTRSIIVKQQHEGKKAEALKEINVFKVEIKMYNDVLRQMEYLMDEFGDNRDHLWCQMYGFQPFNTIAFEDLTVEGFKVADRKKGLDINHAQLVLKSLGRLHAMSKILMERGIIAESDFQPFYAFCDYDIIVKMYSGGMNQLSRVMKKSWPPEWKDIAERIGKQEPLIVDRIRKLGKEEINDPFIVLNHGDSWTCNFMFKYNEDNIPTSMKFVDFQCCHASPYIWDVVHFLHTSVIPHERRTHIKQLYKTYWESLHSNLIKFGYTKNIPTFENLLKEAERIEFFAFVMLALGYSGTTADLDVAFDLEKALDKDCSEGLGQDAALSSPKFINECAEDFRYFANKGIF